MTRARVGRHRGVRHRTASTRPAAPAAPLRERRQEAFVTADSATLVAHLESLAGTTIRLPAPAALPQRPPRLRKSPIRHEFGTDVPHHPPLP